MRKKRLLVRTPVLLLLLLATLFSYAQNRTITGKVTDAKDGAPLANVSIVPKGSSKGVTSGADGSFRITVNATSNTLIFSSVGFGTRSVGITGDVLNIQLSATNSALNEVIVIGYGTQRKREVTGAIARVGGEKISEIPVPSFEAALEGRAPGVQVISGNGLAGSGSVIRIRGIGSISASGDPLYVVDGIPIISDPFIRGNAGAMNQNPLSSINPNDIESIEILKDAGATGIYGSRGANGVVLITTKRGKTGQLQFTYAPKLGVATYTKKQDFVNGPEWLQLRQEAWMNDGNTGYPTLPGALTWAQASQTNTDWWDLLTQTGFIDDHSLSMTAGTQKLKTFANLTYSNDEGYLKKNAYTRMDARLNMDYNVLPNLKVSLTSAYGRGINKRVKAAWDGGIGEAMSSALPIFPVYNSAHSDFYRGLTNPALELAGLQRRQTDTRALAGLSVEFQPIHNLFVRANYSLEYTWSNDDQYTAPVWDTTQKTGFAQRSPNWGANQTANVTANYLWNPGEHHKFNFMVGGELQDYKRDHYSTDPITRYQDRPFWEDGGAYRSLRDSLLHAPVHITEVALEQFTFNSIFARINYTFHDKYSFQLIGRTDGSSKFGPNHKHGFFPAVSAAWNISDEDFMKGIHQISYLKLRASYGIVGNANFPAGSYYDAYNQGGNPYNGLPTIYYNAVGNPDLRWETLHNVDAAAEFGLFNNRLTGEVAYYHKTTTNILLNPGVSPSIGIPNIWRNLPNSKILNQGLEVSANFRVIDGRDVKWSIGGNIARNQNKVLEYELGPDAVSGGTNDTRIVKGLPVGVNYLVRYHGVDPTDGLPIWLDKNGKETKTFTLDNRTYVGTIQPDYFGGFNTTIQYKGLELSSLFTYVIGGNIYENSGKYQFLGVSKKFWNFRKDFLDRWTKPGDRSMYPRLVSDAANYPGVPSEDQFNSTMFLRSASYLRMRELTIAYRVPPAALRKLFFKSLRLFATGTNLLTFTKYPGGDPEITRDFENAQDRNLSPNITYLTAPTQKTFVFGINANF
ncbi:MAG TPA: TonB-dependent receptor [Puia sp.]|nr:TonB-dependent receptor [Puia sp.]